MILYKQSSINVVLEFVIALTMLTKSYRQINKIKEQQYSKIRISLSLKMVVREEKY
jgi:hypothetical protein